MRGMFATFRKTLAAKRRLSRICHTLILDSGAARHLQDAQDEGVNIVLAPLGEMTGYTHYERDKKPYIVLNEDLDDPFLAVVLAHELRHARNHKFLKGYEFGYGTHPLYDLILRRIDEGDAYTFEALTACNLYKAGLKKPMEAWQQNIQLSWLTPEIDMLRNPRVTPRQQKLALGSYFWKIQDCLYLYDQDYLAELEMRPRNIMHSAAVLSDKAARRLFYAPPPRLVENMLEVTIEEKKTNYLAPQRGILKNVFNRISDEIIQQVKNCSRRSQKKPRKATHFSVTAR